MKLQKVGPCLPIWKNSSQASISVVPETRSGLCGFTMTKMTTDTDSTVGVSASGPVDPVLSSSLGVRIEVQQLVSLYQYNGSDGATLLAFD